MRRFRANTAVVPWKVTAVVHHGGQWPSTDAARHTLCKPPDAVDDLRLASSRLHADISRLRAQATLSWSHEIEVLSRLGLRDGMSILAWGSGPGFITELLLRTLPHCSVTAV